MTKKKEEKKQLKAEKDQMTIEVKITYRNKVLGKIKEFVRDEYLDLREGPYQLEHKIQSMGQKVVRETFKVHNEKKKK